MSVGCRRIVPDVLRIDPLWPPPPNISALPFQSSGRFPSSLIGGAAGSTGAISAVTRQHAPTARGALPAAATDVAPVARAPLVDRWRSEAGIAWRTISEQVSGAERAACADARPGAV